MAWIYLAESADSLKPWKATSRRSPIVKMIDTPRLSFFLEWLAETSRSRRSGTMSKQSPQRTLPPPEIIYGGFPCQDISVAGRGEGLGGERSGLFSEIVRLASELRPQFIFLENVPAIRTRGADVVVGELAHIGYDSRWLTLSAAEIGANHIRERWWLLANAQRAERWPREPRGTNCDHALRCLQLASAVTST